MDVEPLYEGKVNKQKRIFNLSKAYKQRWKLNIYEKKGIQTKMGVETLCGGKSKQIKRMFNLSKRK